MHVVGAQGRNRTTDTRIFSPLLYQLSYLGQQDMDGWALGKLCRDLSCVLKRFPHLKSRSIDPHPQPRLLPGNGHAINQPRAGADAAGEITVIADGNQALEHGFEIAGDGDFLDWILNLAVLHPEAGGAA